MIHINLLPEEYRQKARTPIKLLATIIAVVTINSSLAAWWGWKFVGEMAEVESELAVLQDSMDSLEPQIQYHRKLEKESQLSLSRQKTLETITQNRISWTEKVDQVIDIIHQGGEEDRYLVWLDDMQMSQTADARKKNYGTLKASGHSGSNSLANVALFLDGVEKHPFGLDFSPPAPPENTGIDENEDLVPRFVTNFPFQLSLLPPEERAARRALLAGLKSKEARR